MIALANIVCGGVVEDFPSCAFGFLEAGCGWAAYWVERLDEHFERRSREMPKMTKEPTEYFADGNLFLSAEPDERLIPVVAGPARARLRDVLVRLPAHRQQVPVLGEVREGARRPPRRPAAEAAGANAARYYGLTAA